MRFKLILLFALVLLGVTPGFVQAQPAPDLIIVNGKILTVDADFTIVEALAIGGGKVRATGSNNDIRGLAGGATRVIDLGGKTVIPGLIDNHLHFIRGATRWGQEVRIDGIDSRAEALQMIAAKAKSSKPGQWIMILGGWSENQFRDKKGGFSPAELDRAAPDNPVFIQQSYRTVYVNSAALKAAGVNKDTRIPRGKRGRKGKAKGKGGPGFARAAHPAGIPLYGRGAIGLFRRQLAPVSPAQIVRRLKSYMLALNQAGLTTVYGVGRTREGDLTPVAELDRKGQLTVRVFHVFRNDARQAHQVERSIERIAANKGLTMGASFGRLGLGEHLYNPMTDGVLRRRPVAPVHFENWGRIAEAAAANGWHVHEHAMKDETIGSMLDEVERIDAKHSVRKLRWTIAHADTIRPETIARAKRLGMNLAIHNKSMLQAQATMQRLGDAVLGFAPMRTIQESGILWGLGSDATIVAPYQPFVTLGWAVTGKALDGTKVTDQTVTRAQALIAHTRSNAEILFKEKKLGSLEPGKFADLLVLDRDYLSVPADDIRKLSPVITMLGGKVVWQAAN